MDNKEETNNYPAFDDLTHDEKSLLLYLETRAVDSFGMVDGRHMNAEDCDIAKKWNKLGFIEYRRILTEHQHGTFTTAVRLSEQAISYAHKLRAERIKRNEPKMDEICTPKK